MYLSLRLHKNIIVTTGVGLAIVFGGMYMLHHVNVAKQSRLANGLLVDMLITFPVAFYFLIVKPYQIRKASMLLVFSLCCLVAYLILPVQQQHYILQLRRFISLCELGFVVYAITKARQIMKVYQAKQNEFPDSAYHLRESMVMVLGNLRAVRFFAAELAVLRYGVLAMRKERLLERSHQRFGTHRESGYIALFSIFIFVSLIEIVGLHLILMQNHKTIAFVVTLFSIYGTVFLIADLSAIIKRPILVIGNQLILRTGIRWRAITLVENVQEVVIIKNDLPAINDCYKGGVTKSAVNVLISFKEEIAVERLYKGVVIVKNIAMSVDKAEEFKALLDR